MTIIPAPKQRRQHDFTLTMINIVFLLLLFFLTTGSLTNGNEAQSTVPVTQDLPLERLPRPLLLLQADGSLFLDGRAIGGDGLVAAARTAVAATGKADTAVNLLAQPDMPAAPFLAVSETLRSVGIPVRIVTVRRRFNGAVADP